MGRISTGVGLVSGINSGQIIDQLISLEERPKVQLQVRIEEANARKAAYLDLSARLTSLKTGGQVLSKPSTFQNATATSTDDGVLTATADKAAAVGSYTFRVARLVTTQQAVGRGFADATAAPVGAGKITLELGGGELTQPNDLSSLNGGAGVSRGQFRVTDRRGGSAVIDTGDAVTLDDVIRKINTQLDANVRAEVDGDHLKLTDRSGGTGRFVVQDLGAGTSAADLGIVADVNNATVAGERIQRLDRATALTAINDGRGLRTAGATADDFSIKTADGSTFNVRLGEVRTVGEVIDAINAQANGKVTASVGPNGRGIRLADRTPPPGPPRNIFGQPTGPAPAPVFTVTAKNGSKAAADLGIEGTVNTANSTGRNILAGLGTVLSSSLFGGTARADQLGGVTIKSRAAGTAVTVDLNGAQDVAEVLGRINGANAGVRAELNDSGNGLRIVDTSGGTGDLVIGDAPGTQTATLAGLKGTYSGDVREVNGSNLQRAWVNDNLAVKDYNGGRGVSAGEFRITDAAGRSATVRLDGTERRLGDVVAKINAAGGVGAKVRVNDNGDGLQLDDTSGGAGLLKVEDLDGTAAADLRLAGEARAGETKIDGSFELTIDVTATDTLETVQRKVQEANFGVFASVLNDGTADAPFRLSLTSRHSGRAGRVVIDGGATGLATRTLVDAQNAAVFAGGDAATGGQPLLITSNTNQIAGAIQNVNLELHGVSKDPVTLNVARTLDNVQEAIGTFAENFNGLVEQIGALTKFDPQTNERGVLLGDSSVQTVEQSIYAALRLVNPAGGRYRILADIGLRLGEGAKLEFDAEKFKAAYADDPEAVADLFTAVKVGFGAKVDAQVTRLTDPVDGVLKREQKTIDDVNDNFTKRISQLDARLAAKRDRLTRQFAQMESVLSGLQGQQQALGQIQPLQLSA